MAQTCTDVDTESGLNYNFLSVVVFNFFPFSNRGFMSGSLRNMVNGPEWLYTGSLMEHLDLPLLINKSTGERLMIDHDIMAIADFSKSVCPNVNIVITGEETTIGNFPSHGLAQVSDNIVIQDKQHPLHCYIQVPPQCGIHHIQKHHPEELSDIVCNGYLNARVITTTVKKHVRTETYFDPKYETIKQVDVEYHVDDTEKSFIGDFVPCLKVKCPESILQKLIERGKAARNTSLPKLQRIVKDLHDENIHVVYKPHVHSSNPDIQWRFSFSLMERKLARSLNDTQRTAYRVLKALVLLRINNKTVNKDHKLPSYLLKTTLFWVCEGLPKGFCIPKNIGKFFIKLLDKLITLLGDKNKGKCHHYFIPEGNLLDSYPAAIVEIWIKHLRVIQSQPLEAMREFWKIYEFGGNKIDVYFKLFPDYAKPQQTDKLLCSAFSLHLSVSNFIDYMRLYTFVNSVFCFCKKAWITDFFLGCKKCMIAKFCDITQGLTSDLPVRVISKMANLWFVRSLHDKRNSSEYEEKAVYIFKLAMSQCIIQYHWIHYYIHYALYLRSKRKYEQAAHTIIQLLLMQSDGSNNEEHSLYIPCFLSDMLDEVLQIKSSGYPDRLYISRDLAYHILVSCYSQAGVYTELILPPNVADKELVSSLCKSEFKNSDQIGLTKVMNLVFELAQEHIGHQFYLSKDYYQAAERYIFPLYRAAGNSRGFLVCIARLFQPNQFQESIDKYLKPVRNSFVN